MNESGWVDLEATLNEQFRQGAKRPKRLQTGFSRLDRALGGGFAPGLIILGGPPSVGKSTFSLQIAETAARQGTHVLYFSLEMPADRIAAKALNRSLFRLALDLYQALPQDPAALQGASPLQGQLEQYSELAELTADRLLDGAVQLSQRQWAAVEQVKRSPDFLRGVQHLHVWTASLPASGIVKLTEQFLEQEAAAGRGAEKPLVIIDYLQILQPETARSQNEKQTIDSSLKHLIHLAHNVNGGLPVMLISSLNRSSYTGPMQISAFKETGGIEYSADLLLGLQFSACHEKGADLAQERRRIPRKVEISVLKNRYGSSGGLACFDYFSARDCFLETSGSPQDALPAMADFAALLAAPPAESPAPAAEPAVPAAPPSPPPVPPEPAPPSTREAPGPAVPSMREDPAGAAERAAPPPEEPRPAGESRESVLYFLNNTRVANEIRKGASGARSCEVLPARGGNKAVRIEYELSEPLSSFDCAVADAVYTLYRDRPQAALSFSAILRCLSGDPVQTMTGKKKKTLTDSVQRLARAQLRVACTEELRARGKAGPQEERVFQGPFLPAREQNGKYRLTAPLPLYAYMEENGQIIAFPPRLLDILEDGRRMSSTEEAICLKRFLIRRLEIIRVSSDGQPFALKMRKISFKPDGELLQELGLRPDGYQSAAVWRQKCLRLHKAAARILEHYKRIGYITDYEVSDRRDAPGLQITGPIRDPRRLPQA